MFALNYYYANLCARTVDGRLWCWGDNESGQVGDGTFDDPLLSPVEVVALGPDVIDVGVGGKFTCAVKADGTLWCPGQGATKAPVQILALGSDVAAVAAGPRAWKRSATR